MINENFIKLGNIVLFNNLQLNNSINEEYLITYISPINNEGLFDVYLSSFNSKYPSIKKLSVTKNFEIALHALKNNFTFTDNSICDKSSFKEIYLEQDLFFFESSAESLELFLGKIGDFSDGGYLIKEGKYFIELNLEKLLEMSNKHEISFKIRNGNIFLY